MRLASGESRILPYGDTHEKPGWTIFGRSQALLSAWAYLGDRNASVGLARINPFGIDQAKAYIDAYAAPASSSHRKEYEQSRDHILKQLGSAFSASSQRDDDGFLSFIGYPPVLDAIATLLTTERNYHRLNQAIESGEGTSLEVRLLVNIASYLLNREQKEKAHPNFITQITSGTTKELAQKLASELYDETEQCARVLSRALGVPFPVQVVQDRALNDRYEKSLDKWCPEHPFLAETRVRNPVFAAVAITKCALSKKPEYQKLANDYVSLHRSSYHLLYIMSEIASGSTVNPLFFNALIQSSSDFISKGHGVSVDFSGLSWDEEDLPEKSPVDLDVKVYSLSPGRDEDRSFTFSGELEHTQVVVLGPNLPDVSVTVPSQIKVIGKHTIDCSGVCHISAATVEFESQDLIVRSLPSIKPGTKHGLYVHAAKLSGHTVEVETKGADLVLLCEESHLAYPLAKYTTIVIRPTAAPESMKKYRRLRRILSEFASHSKGGLAKFRAKIEHERVLRGELGRVSATFLL